MTDTAALTLALDALAAAAAETDRHAVGVQSGAAKALSNATQTRNDAADILAAVDAIRAALAAEPPAPAPATLIGACPLTGGMSTAAGERVITRWGTGAVVRLFSPSGWTLAPVLTGAGRIIASWKPPLGVPLDRALMRLAVANLPAGSRVWVWHESDVKVIKGSETFERMRQAHREFAAFIREERPDLVLVGIVAGYRFAPGQDLARLDGYIDPATFDMLGVDLDGITDKYADFTTFIPGVMAYLERIGMTRWTVPEFGAPRQPEDTTGATRAAWMAQQVTALRALPNPPEDVALFESTAYAGTELTAQVELDAWAALTP